MAQNSLPPPVVQPRYVDEHQAIGVIGSLVIMMLHHPPSAALIQETYSVLDRLASRSPSGGALLLVIAEDTPPMAEQDYKQLSDILRTRKLCCAAIVIEGSGFAAAGQRAAAATIGLAARGAFPVHTFGDIEASAEWLQRELGKREHELVAEAITHAAFVLSYRAKRESIPG